MKQPKMFVRKISDGRFVVARGIDYGDDRPGLDPQLLRFRTRAITLHDRWRRHRIHDRTRARGPNPRTELFAGGECGVGQVLSDPFDLLRFAVHKDDRNVAREFGAANGHRHFAAVAGKAGEVDDERIRLIVADRLREGRGGDVVELNLVPAGLAGFDERAGFGRFPVNDANASHHMPE